MRGTPKIVARHDPLLLIALGGWTAAIRAAAALADVKVEEATSAPDAIRLMAAGGSRFSHLLVEPRLAGDSLAVLTDLTAGEPTSGTSLVLLGQTKGRPDHACAARTHFVPRPAKNWLSGVFQAGMPPQGVSAALSASDLRAALAESRIGTRYQPIVRMSDRCPVGLEVLARLHDPERGTLPPDLFVPSMEQAGLARLLTMRVIQRAFEDWGGGKLAATGLCLALNVPLDVLLIPSALAWLERRRDLAGIPAGRIVIELTESQPITELARLGHATECLRALGYGLAIDDVGPNIRDYRALLTLSFTSLKLDRHLVADAMTNDADRVFLLRTLDAARAAGLRIVAEGIQDTATWDGMAAWGVDQAQGFLVGRPLPADAVRPWLSDWRERHQALADQTAR